MSDLHITWVDFFVAVMVIASMGFAIYRGFVRETLTIFSWGAAAFSTLYFGRYVVPLMAPHFSPLMAEIAAYSAVFVLVLLPLSFIGHRISQSVQGSPVGPVDRSLGAAFGVLRGFAVVAMVYILYSLVVPVHAQKPWITSARSLPVIQTSAKVLLSLLPSEQSSFVQERTGKPTTDAVDTGSTAKKTRNAADAGTEPTSKPKTTAATPPGHVKHVVRAAEPVHHVKKTHTVKLAHATTETEPAASAVKSAPAQPAAPTSKKTGRKGYGADDRRALNRLIESTGNGGGR